MVERGGVLEGKAIGFSSGIAAASVEHELTASQSRAIRGIAEFVDDDDHDVFVLKGYAGTGKTFLISLLTDSLSRSGRTYRLAAPTGRAARVITEKTRLPATTIHSLIYNYGDIRESKIDGLDGSETFKLVAQKYVNDLPSNSVFIVDEASLISDIYSDAEFFQSGSGFLLRDLLHYINFDHNIHKKKLILIGDDAQLPPVGMSYSPALNIDHLRDKHGVRCRTLELTDVVRQKADSGVLKNVAPLRDCIRNGVFNKISFDTSLSDVTEVKSQDVVPAYLDSCGHEVNNKSVLIARSNAEAGEFNRSIREHLFPGCLQATDGDKLMVVRNTDVNGIRINNGDFVWVKSLASEAISRKVTIRRKSEETGLVEETKVRLSFRDAHLGYRLVDGRGVYFDATILENLLYDDSPELSSEQQKALYVDFCLRHNRIRKKPAEFRMAIRRDPFFNALRVKFGYALTCHKAQGSEWKNVFVSCHGMGNDLAASNFRWLYTALTRASDRLHLLNPPNIQIGGGIRLAGVAKSAFERRKTDTTVPLNTEDQPKEQVGQLPSDVVENETDICAFIRRQVKVELAGTGIEIDATESNSYQEAYFFSRGGDWARINIFYNRKSQITRMLPQQECVLSQEILRFLSPLKGLSARPRSSPDRHSGARGDVDGVLSFGQPFLDEFHCKLLDRAKEKDISVTDVREMQWCQRYSFESGSETAEIDIFYNSKGVFTKCQPVGHKATFGPLVTDVIELLTDGMST